MQGFRNLKPPNQSLIGFYVFSIGCMKEVFYRVYIGFFCRVHVGFLSGFFIGFTYRVSYRVS